MIFHVRVDEMHEEILASRSLQNPSFRNSSFSITFLPV